MGEVLQIEIDGPVATFTLNRPEAMNAFDDALKDALRHDVGRINDNADVRVVILKGAGRGFCAGADLKGSMDPVSFHLDIEYKPFLTGIERSEKLWIAQVHGAAAGAGAGLAMACDLMTMSEDAYIYLAFASIALVPDAGNVHHLHRHLGYKKAMEAILEGKKITAEDCLQAGITNKVVPADTLDTATRDWADHLAQSAPLALASVKRLLRRAPGLSLGEMITEEGYEQAALLKSEDFREGVKAFFDKRKPVWKGR